MKMDSFTGASPPSPHYGLVRAPPSDPRFRLALSALAMIGPSPPLINAVSAAAVYM